MNTPTQLDTSPITAQITRLIATGTTEQALLTAVAHLFPELTPYDLSAAASSSAKRAPTKSKASESWATEVWKQRN